MLYCFEMYITNNPQNNFIGAIMFFKNSMIVILIVLLCLLVLFGGAFSTGRNYPSQNCPSPGQVQIQYDWIVCDIDFGLKQYSWTKEYKLKNSSRTFFITVGNRKGKSIIAINAIDHFRNEIIHMFILDGVVMSFTGRYIYLWFELKTEFIHKLGLPEEIVSELNQVAWLNFPEQVGIPISY